jgi:dUTP pyrophosphatase
MTACKRKTVGSDARVQIKFKRLDPSVAIPARKYPGDAGFDIEASIDIVLMPGTTEAIPTGLCCKIPDGYYIDVKEKSGRAIAGIGVGGGVVDNGYTGEIKVILRNTKRKGAIDIKKGQSIAQMLILPVPAVEFIEVDELPVTDRGVKGFGSTDEPETVKRPKQERRGRSRRTKRVRCSKEEEE